MILKLIILCLFFNSSFVAAAQPLYKLSIAAIFQNEAVYLDEWIKYHRMVGVEHFLLYNDASEDDWQKVLNPYIAEGVVEVISWPSQSRKHFIGNQISAYQDALKKLNGVSEWLALIDLDEFLLPAQERTVTDCLKKHFSQTTFLGKPSTSTEPCPNL